jgi:AcrR family transcriptional regulator
MKVRRTNAERSRSTRAQLLDAARRLFADQGFAATSITQVAAAAQLSTGALYHHWSTKQEILAAVVSGLHHELAVEIAGCVPAGVSPLARFEYAALVFLRRCGERDVGRILLVDGPAILGEVWAELDQRWWLGPTEEVFRQAIDEGELVAADPRLLATALLGSLTALGRTITLRPDPDATEIQAAQRVLRSLIDGLRTG